MSLPDPLGVFGGTFDPIHHGHLRLAEEAVEALGLESVRCIPAGAPPLRDTPRTAPAHRLEMLRLAVADNPRLVVDESEIRREGPSYTVDTLRRLRDQVGPTHPLVLLLGADAFARLEAWHAWRELFALAHIAVATRPGHELKVGVPQGLPSVAGGTALDAEFRVRRRPASALREAPGGAIVPFAITPLDISATSLRERLTAGRSIRYLLPAPVLDYIQANHLYR